VANEGYYVKSVRINGRAVDPYAPDASYRISNLLILGSTIEGSTDPRITSLRLQVRNLSSDLQITAEFQRLYFKVSIGTIGSGSVNIQSARVNYGDDLTMIATTTDAFYVASYIVNGGIPTTYKSNDSAQNVTLSLVREDKIVMVEFKRKLYPVNFVGAKSTITYDAPDENGNLVSVTEALGFSTVQKESASSIFVIIRAEEGYKITRISVNGAELVVPFNALRYDLRIDDINGAYNIEIGVEAITYNIIYYLANAATDDPETEFVEGTIVLSADETISYGGSFNMIIELGSPTKTLTNYYENTDQVRVYNRMTGEDITALVNKTVEENEALPGQWNIKIERFPVNMTEIEIFVPIQDTHDDTLPPDITYDVFFRTDLSKGIITFGRLQIYDPETGITHTQNEFGPPHKDGSQGTAGSGWTLEISVDPVSPRYELKYLIVNGLQQRIIGNTFTLSGYGETGIAEDQYIEAVFDTRLYNLSVAYGENGMATAQKTTFYYGDTDVWIRVIATEGYEVESFSLVRRGEPYNKDQTVVDYLNAGHTDYRVPDYFTDSDLDVMVYFAPKKFVLNVNKLNSGSLKDDIYKTELVSGIPTDIEYGDFFPLQIAAGEGYYIESIFINGIAISLDSLRSAIISEITQKYTYGVLDIDVTENVAFYVVFSPNVYRAGLAATVGGTTLVSAGSSGFSDGSALGLDAGDALTIRMRADTGYHIESLTINDVLLPEDMWKVDLDQENNNRLIDYVYYPVLGNVYVKVVYAVNKYTVSYTITNASPNFAPDDAAYSQFGLMTLYGYAQNENNVYAGIVHGSDIRFVFQPVAAKGYYVSLFTVGWYDPENRESGEATVNNYTSDAAANGQYVYANVRGNLQVTVEFKRRLYSFTSNFYADQRSSQFASDGSLITTFTNPQAPSRAVTTVDGKYEYGISYSIQINPGLGYKLKAFTVNGVDRMTSVRTGTVLRFSGEVRSDDVDVFATFEVISYSVTVSASTVGAGAGGTIWILDENRNPIWKLGETNAVGFIFVNGDRIDISAIGVSATYGTLLYFRIIPARGSGYYISSVLVNNTTREILTPGSDTDVACEITGISSSSVIFRKYNYQVKVTSNESGGSTAVSSENVDWGSSAEISLSIYEGYILKQVKINGNADSGALERLISAGRLTINDIREYTLVELVFDRDPHSVTFTGDYKTEHDFGGPAVAGFVINDGSSGSVKHFTLKDVAGVPITSGANLIPAGGVVAGGGADGARFKDRITIYLLPADGYRIASVSIKMKDSAGNDQTLASSVSQLSVYDSQKGYYSYAITLMTGDITVNVTYAVKTYLVRMNQPAQLVNPVFSFSVGTYIAHHSDISLSFDAAYGYHLESISINNRVVPTNYTLVGGPDSSRVYHYTTTIDGANLNVNNALINGLTELTINLLFQINTFAVRLYVNGNDVSGGATDPTLIPTLSGNRATYSQPAIILQQLAEGYYIDSLCFQNTENYVEGVTSRKEMDDVTSGASYLFYPTGYIIDMLDYHSPTNRTIYIKYTTQIKRHTSEIESYTLESGYPTSAVPVYGSSPAFTLDVSYGDHLGSGDLHDYNTSARFNFTFNTSGADSHYLFAGFQEKNPVTQRWEFCRDGVNGLSIVNGRTLSYQIKGERQFRALVFRLYYYTITVYPEYKYITGSYNPDELGKSMYYSKYLSLTASARVTDSNAALGIKPDIAGNVLALDDKDAASGVYLFRVPSGTLLTAAYSDSLLSSNRTTSVTYSWGGTTLTLNGSAADTATGDKDISAYFYNNLMMSFSVETVGGTTGGEGGVVTFVDMDRGTALNLRDNSITVSAGKRVKITIAPNNNYFFSALLQREADTANPVDSAGFRNYTQNWNGVVTYDAEHGTFATNGSVTFRSELVGGKTVYVVEILATENAMYKVRFWKNVRVERSVQLFTDESLPPAVKADFNAQIAFLTGTSDAGIKKYNDKFRLVLPKPTVLPTVEYTYSLRYQFIGFYVNGVNTFQNLSYQFPKTYDVEYTISTDTTLPNHVNIVNTGTEFLVSFTAVYIPIYTIVLENEYIYNSPYGDITNHYFDVGMVSLTTKNYSIDRAQSNATTGSAMPKTSTTPTDKTFQALGKTNDPTASDLTLMTSKYNVWTDNVMALSWDGQRNYGEYYTFKCWQYYDGATHTWRNLTYTDPSDPANIPTSPSYRLPFKELIALSYFMLGDPNSGAFVDNPNYRTDAAQYINNQYSGSTINIYAIRIRPLLQRRETISVDCDVTYDGSAGDTLHQYDNPIRISGSSGSLTAVRDYDSIVTIDPATQAEYIFNGWKTSIEGPFITRATHPVEGAADLTINQPYGVLSDNSIIYRVLAGISFIAYYTKTWQVQIEVINISGPDNNYLRNSTPFLNYRGDLGTSADDRNYIRTLPFTTILAGTSISFGFNFYNADGTPGTSFDSAFDSYYGATIGVYQGSSIITNNFLPSSGTLYNGLSDQGEIATAGFTMKVNAKAVIKLYFQTKGRLVISSIFAGSTLKIPTALFNTLRNDAGWTLSSPFIADGATSFDADGADDNGSITISGIPIRTDNAVYADRDIHTADEYKFGVQLRGMDSGVYMRKNVINYNFNGNMMNSTTYTKEQTIVYFGRDSGFNSPFAGGNGTADTPYLISDKAQFLLMATFYNMNGSTGLLNVYFKMTANIALTQSDLNDFGGMLCATGPGFNGVLDGDYHSISGFVIQLGSADNVGLFSTINGGTVKNLTLGGAINVTGRNYVGILAGKAINAIISKVTMDATGKYVTAIQDYAGGLIGWTQCSSSSTASISECNARSISEVVARRYAGGFVGGVGEYSSITSSFVENTTVRANGAPDDTATTTVNENTLGYMGGFVGITSGSDRLGTPAISGCYVTQPSFSSDKEYKGGFVGYNGGTKTISSSYVKLNLSASYTSTYSVNATDATSIPNITNYGMGMFAGFNNGAATIKGCSLTSDPGAEGSVVITLNGSVVGGFIGVNAGAIDGIYVINPNYTVTLTNVISERIRFVASRALKRCVYNGVFAAYNSGTISYVKISEQSNDINYAEGTARLYQYTVLAGLDYSVSHKTSEGCVTSISNNAANNDSSTVYIGGITAYNAGTLLYNQFSDKIQVHRSTNIINANKIYIGEIAGFNVSTGTRIDENIVDGSIAAYFYVWVDSGGAATPMFYLGSDSGNGELGALSYYNVYTANKINLTIVGIGIAYTDAKQYSGVWPFGSSGSNAKGYLSGTVNTYAYNPGALTRMRYITTDLNTNLTGVESEGVTRVHEDWHHKDQILSEYNDGTVIQNKIYEYHGRFRRLTGSDS